MKTPKLSHILFLATFLFILITCKNRESNNPFDTACPKEVFTPSDLKAEQQGAAVKLTWKQTNTNISGFVINCNENDGAMTEVAKVDKTFSRWNDENIVADKKYGYQLLAYAGENLSNMLVAYCTPINKTVVTTDAVSGITSTSAVLGGNATNDSGIAITERGVCYSNNVNPTTADVKVEMGSGSGAFSLTIIGLKAGYTYYARAYASTKQGTTYGTPITFTTSFLTVTPTSYIVSKDGDSKVFTVASNIDWKISSNQTWCTLSANSGKGNGSITVTYTENKEVPQRTATITFTGTGVPSQSVTITQAGTEPPAFSITPANQNANNLAGTTTFAITSNVAWTATIDQSWCKITNTSGTGNATLNVNYEANTTNSQRVATITFSAIGLQNKIVTITQAALISQTWNMASEYSTSKNPNAVWSYGRKWSADVDDFDLMSYKYQNTFWLLGSGVWYPSIQSGPDMWAQDNSNGLPCIRWTCPESGNYSLISSFTGADSRGVDVLVYISKNGSVIFSNKIQTNGAKVEYSINNLILEKNNHLDFVIKWNGGGSPGESSWTLVSAIITK